MATMNSSNIKDAGIVYTAGAGVFAGNNLSAVTNTIASTDTDGDIILSPNGTGGAVVTTDLTVGNAVRDVEFTINGALLTGVISAETTGASDLGGIIMQRHGSTAAFGGHFVALRSRGTSTTPTIVSSGDTLSLMASAGFDGTDYALAGQIIMQVDGTPGADDMPGRIVFLTSADGGQTPIEAMRIDSSQRVGINNPTLIDEFNISGAMDIQHTSTASDDHALEIDISAAGFGDVKAIDVAYTTGAIGAGDEEAVILVNIDESASTGGEIVGYEMLSTSEGSDAKIALKSGVGIEAIRQLTGTFGDADNILNIAVDVTAALANGGAGNISAFVNDNDTMTIGDAATFDELEVIIGTVASGSGIAPTFQYSTGGAAYSTFTPVDGTNGMRNSGVIDWDSADLTGWATATSGEYEIIITRTRNSLGTTPIIDEMQISAATIHKWDENGAITAASIALSANTSYAVLCGGTTGTGAIQSIASVGTSGQVLTSNGAAALPTMQTLPAATDVNDSTFRIQDDGDPSKEIAFEASGITGSTVRTITMPDADITLLIPSNVAITGGAIDGTTIGATTPAAGTFDDLTLDDISGSYADAEQVFKQAGVQTTNTTPTQIAAITLTTNTMVTVEARFNGFIDDFSASCGGRVFYTARRVAGGAVEVGTPIVDVIEDSAGAPTVDADVSGNDVRLLVTGVGVETWNWTVSYNYNFTKTNA
jgi:hypothetical protein